MTRKEIIKLLEMMMAAYPNAKIVNPSELVSAWELSFGQDKADVIYKAARHHMNTNKFFPTVADIKSCINKGQMLYGDSEASVPKIATKKIPEVNCPLNDHHCILLGDLCDGAEDGKCPFEGL